MPSFFPAKKNTSYTFYLGLISQATRPQFQINPTLAVGDVKISTDGGTLNNIDILPVVTPTGGRLVKTVVAASDMNGDNIAIQFIDAAGAEWDEAIVTIQTVARQIDDLAYPTTTGRSIDVDINGGVEVGSFQASSIINAAFSSSAIGGDIFALSAGSKVWDAAVRALTATVTVGTNNDKTGYGLSASAITTGVFTDATASHVADITLTGTTLAELSQGQPSATPTLAQAEMLPYMALRNSASTTSGCLMITNNAGTVITKASLSDNASTFERTKMVSGP